MITRYFNGKEKDVPCKRDALGKDFIRKKEEDMNVKKRKKRALEEEYRCQLCVSQSFTAKEELAVRLRDQHNVRTYRQCLYIWMDTNHGM